MEQFFFTINEYPITTVFLGFFILIVLVIIFDNKDGDNDEDDEDEEL